MLKKILFLSCLCWMGCKQAEPIVTTRVAKENTPTVGAPAEKSIEWTLPAGWIEQIPSNMRVGSFLVKSADGRLADISIVPLAGDAGGDLSNVNRWRGQLNLAPITASDLEKETHIITPGGRRMRLVDVAKDNKRLVATIYTHGQKSWFFKMMGDDALVKATTPSFLAFLASVKINEHE